ncbi:MAG: SDR family oxidoreductase, partial [Phycisphaerae bacterium]|nr:SDR family oxidoreductase [Phycisphaerae bacterium]
MLLEADLADPQAAAALPGRVAAKFGGLNIVVNNASVFEAAPLAKLDAATMQRTFAVNVAAPVLIARAAAEHLKAAGDGRIVNITDISSERPWTGYLAYCASKAALESATRSLAKELAPHILVNAVAPGIVNLPEGIDDAARDAIVERIPVRRVGSPEEVAAAVMYFVRDARYTSGMILRVDGGRCIAW